jgi:hypothetical protein
MTLYARSDITQVVVGATGCRHAVKVKKDGSHERLVVSCAVCEPLLRNDPGWSPNPADVPLTVDEQRAAEKAREQQLVMLAGAGAMFGQQAAGLASNPQFLQALQALATPPIAPSSN